MKGRYVAAIIGLIVIGTAAFFWIVASKESFPRNDLEDAIQSLSESKDWRIISLSSGGGDSELPFFLDFRFPHSQTLVQTGFPDGTSEYVFETKEGRALLTVHHRRNRACYFTVSDLARPHGGAPTIYRELRARFPNLAGRALEHQP